MLDSWKIMENHGHNNYGICWPFYGEIIFKSYFEWLNWFFPLRIGIIKSRLHYFRGQKLQISWFLNVLMCFWASKPLLFIFGETRIPQKILESIWEHPGKILSMEIWDSKKSKILDHVGTQLLNFWNFEILKFLYIKWLYMEKIFLWRWGPEND